MIRRSVKENMGPIAMPTPAGSSLRLVLTMCAVALALGCAAATAQAPAPAPAPAPAAKEAQTEDVIVSGKPEQKSRVRQALDRLLGKTESKKLETTGSEVISLPKEKAAELKKRLEKLGAKVTTLRKDWNHILHPAKKDTPLTPKQKAAIETAAKAPETVNVGVLKMPDAAVAELALTKFEQSVGTRGRAGPQDDPYAKVMLPMAGGGHITLVRTRAPDFTPGGVTWVGETEETKERAVLMLWKDGHLSGYFGFKGRVYTVNHVGGDIHTMAEIDPKKLPPDHAPDPKNRNAAVAPPPAPATPPPPPPEPEVAPFADADRQALEAKPIVIDVMLLITKKVVDSYIRNPVDLSTLAIEQANNTFRNSGLGNITLRLVHSQVIDYDEADVDQFDSPLRDGRRGRRLQGPEEAAQREARRHRRDGARQSEGLRPLHPRRRRGRRGILRRASRLRRHHLSRSRTRSATSSARGTTATWTPTTSRSPTRTASSTAPSGAT